MKKIALIAIMLCALVFTSCGSDDPGPRPVESSCKTCDIPGEETIIVCEGTNGNAFVSLIDTGVPFQDYVSRIELSGVMCE